MFQLKEYQQKALDVLQHYFQTTNQFKSVGADHPAMLAFIEVTDDVFGQPLPYHPVPGLEGLPYVCVRMPTGAGKTFVACFAINTAAQDLVQVDHPLVLWLVPSTAILEQTLNALKDPQHPYRRALEAELGAVSVLNVQEALAVTPATLRGGTTIVVSTIQAFRIREDETEARKVYEDAGALMGHFENRPARLLHDLERFENGQPIRSLANVLRLHRPIVIVDEAHNARTDLSFETLTRFRPSCIVEFTATPDTERSPSNVLYTVSAAELKAEEMVKLPILLEVNPNWRQLLGQAIARLNDLQQQADAEYEITGEHLRPVMLIQAQSRRGADPITVETIYETLLQDFGIEEKAIARDAYNYKELEGVDVLDTDCPVRFIITLTSLQEGWDCPTAYVLCSVSEISSGTAVEQILGRIMRLPNVKRKQRDALNQAYAYAASRNFGETAQALVDGLVENGFDRAEAADFIATPGQPHLTYDDLPIFGGAPPQVTISGDATPDSPEIPESLAEKVQYDTETGDIHLTGPLSDEEAAIIQALDESETWREEVDKAVGEVREQYKVRPPAERDETLSVPVLAVEQPELPLSPFNASHFTRMLPLAGMDAAISSQLFPDDPPEPRVARIDVDSSREIQVEFLEELHQEVRLLASDQGWDRNDLVYWLDRTMPRHKTITQQQSTAFLNKALDHLFEERNLSLDRLVHDKYRLRAAITQKVEDHLAAFQKEAFQPYLDLDTTPLIVTDDPDVSFTYDPHAYPCRPYRGKYGPYNFKKHYYDRVGDFDSGEEFQCAIHLDSMAEVEFWVRNPVKSSKAFSLQTSTDRFYPDFVCRLKDGRYLVVEYKGRDRYDNPEEVEKRQIGAVWEKRSEGQCLFIMVTDRVYGTIDEKIE